MENTKCMFVTDYTSEEMNRTILEVLETTTSTSGAVMGGVKLTGNDCPNAILVHSFKNRELCMDISG